ncbi:hypothetical protein GALL_418130 [mine drainage metagenome]|uniref:Uncharacterized protein n=1 Tax=mine drainage metagenome TaxID=410659 RepID=A0A1J5PZV0_9ZZZZ
MSFETAIYIAGAIMIVGAIAITAFVTHLADVDQKERQRRRAARHRPV